MNSPYKSFNSAARGLLVAAVLLPAGIQTLGAQVEIELARNTLFEALSQENGFVKVHAGEVLAAHGERARVHAVFLQEENNHGSELRYRHGIWRTLALTSETPPERASWIERIAEIVQDPTSPDRLHAVESLAKLGGPHSPAVVTATRLWHDHSAEEEAPMLEWLLWQAGELEVVAALRGRLSSLVPVTRLRAAYVLRQIRAADRKTLAALAKAADTETADSAGFPIIVASALLLRASPERLPSWRIALEDVVNSSPHSKAYDALQGLMGSYDTSDIARILPLLSHANGDVRIATAWAILDVDARSGERP